MKLKILLTIIGFSLSNYAYSQEDGKKRIAIYNIDITTSKKSPLYISLAPEKTKAMQQIPEHLLSYYSNSDQFITIDNMRIKLIKDEKELQKSEEFIDGYVVNQGKLEGYDYIFYPRYFENVNEVSVRVYDVANETVFCEATETADVGMFYNTGRVAMKLIDELNASCFSIYTEVVRSLDEQPKKAVKQLLILAGSDQNMKRGYQFDIYYFDIEKVGEEDFKRVVKVGIGEIEKIEGENFSVMEVKKGGKEIKAHLDAGTQLYCKVLKND